MIADTRGARYQLQKITAINTLPTEKKIESNEDDPDKKENHIFENRRWSADVLSLAEKSS